MATTFSASLSGSGGPARVLELEGDRPADLLAAVRHGLPFKALEAIASQLDLPTAAIGALLGIPQRTFARRRKTLQLSPQESDRLYRLAHTFAMAAEVLGSPIKARQWLLSPNRALAGEVPLQWLDTDIGARQVEEVLLRLSYGMFS
jgi:putative toxin-antitoxin system antitoxin component (TIGR02293 family)